ncbi:hypothetical protein D3C76_1185860 [compost metagenome]
MAAIDLQKLPHIQAAEGGRIIRCLPIHSQPLPLGDSGLRLGGLEDILEKSLAEHILIPLEVAFVRHFLQIGLRLLHLVRNPPQTLEHLLGGQFVLDDIIIRFDPESLLHIMKILMAGQEHHPHAGAQQTQRSGHFNSASIRQSDICN